MPVDAPPFSYPAQADGRKQARFHFQSKTHYAGRYGTPESHIMFGLQLAAASKEGGEIPKAKELKPEVEKILGVEPKPNHMRFAWAGMAALLLLVGILVGYALPASDSVSQADRDILRRYHEYQAEQSELSIKKVFTDKVATLKGESSNG